MLINWFTVIAQAINFLILVWLLKRFLYKPILKAIDEREKRIATQLADAEDKKAGCGRSATPLVQERGLRPGASSALEKSQGRGQRRTSATARPSTRGSRPIACQTPGGVAHGTTDPESNDHSLDPGGSLCDRAKDTDGPRHHEPRGAHERGVRWPPARLDGAAKEQLVAALTTGTHTAIVRSAFDLPPAQRNAIEAAVKDTLAATAQVQFQNAPELVSGIELSANGQKVAWSIADYLATLARTATELLHDDAASESTPYAKPQLDLRSEAIPSQEPKPSPGRSVNLNTELNRCPRRRRRAIEKVARQSTRHVRPRVPGISRTLDAFTPRLTPREVGTITSVSVGIAKVWAFLALALKSW